MTTQALLAFALGLSVGSFINVVADRLPRGESLLPRSHCDTCGHELTPLELVPVVSYIFLGGKCKQCGSKIPIRLPIVELLCGLGYAFLVYHFGFTLWGLKYLVFFSFALAVAETDLTTGLVPDQLVIAGGIAGLLFALLTHSFLPSVISSLLLGGIFLLIYALTKGKGLGQGDVTFAFALGLYLNPLQAFLTFSLSFIIGAVVGLISLPFTKSHEMPFCPYMAVGSLIAIMWWLPLIDVFL